MSSRSVMESKDRPAWKDRLLIEWGISPILHSDNRAIDDPPILANLRAGGVFSISWLYTSRATKTSRPRSRRLFASSSRLRDVPELGKFGQDQVPEMGLPTPAH
jgi:hypothetical protein